MENIIPNLSVDCVIFGFGANKLNVLLKERKLSDPQTGEVLINDFTLTGFHVFEGENLDTAAARTLYNITGLTNIFLEQFYAFGSTQRLASEKDQIWLQHLNLNVSNHVISVGYFSLVDSSKTSPDTEHPEAQWFPVDEVPELAFDHAEILAKALEHLRLKVRLEPIAYELLPEKFTIRELQDLYECILGTKFDRRNFRKKVMQMKYLIPLAEKQTGVAHKPAQKFIFSRDVYDRTKIEKLDFSI
jgi:hypothetical protein